MLGQIASFIENLHLTYNEIYEKIPYRNLLLMQKDKLHIVYGDVMVEMNEEDYFKNKNKK